MSEYVSASFGSWAAGERNRWTFKHLLNEQLRLHAAKRWIFRAIWRYGYHNVMRLGDVGDGTSVRFWLARPLTTCRITCEPLPAIPASHRYGPARWGVGYPGCQWGIPPHHSIFTGRTAQVSRVCILKGKLWVDGSVDFVKDSINRNTYIGLSTRIGRSSTINPIFKPRYDLHSIVRFYDVVWTVALGLPIFVIAVGASATSVPVMGTVTIDGEPVKSAKIKFISRDDEKLEAVAMAPTEF